ncbi:hypothetical protein BV22DRAFT_1038767 [Leucogyrophana mollusca]|uniref:Uncharacterized protein n=1 Tax=Leucogyrophana mollusca TaxID=85980 RepID=A0ACB8B729_9AGAM|nr:hypothetical protein BV22DRAFT_1038767 [Leucogyrophana mollusca]
MHPTPKETFLITVVGVVGLIIPPHLHDFYALVEVGGQSRKTASIAHLSQSNIKWEARVGPLTADNDAYVSIRIQASRNSSNTEDMSVAEGGATVEELLANGIKSTSA